MKQHLLLLIAAMAGHFAQAQDPNVQWLGSAGGFSQYDQYRSITDANGNFYTAGSGSGMNFGSGITVAGDATAVARYNASGTIQWARALASVAGQGTRVTCMATDAAGDLWIAGGFSSATLTLDAFTLINTGVSSGFLARLNSSGTVESAVAWGGSAGSGTYAADICADGAGGVYLTGSSDASSFTLNGVTLGNSTGVSQAYVLHFDGGGLALWGSNSNVEYGAQGFCIATDGPGNIYAVVTSTGIFTMGDVTVDTGELTEAILIQLSVGGDAEQGHAIAECDPLDLAVDAVGNAFVSGYIETTATFGTDVLVPSVLDGFVAAYASDGSYRWVVGVQGDIDNELCWSVALNAAQTDLAVSGTFVISATFGGVPMSTGLSPTDGFIMQMDTAGTVNNVIDMTGEGPTLFAQAGWDADDHLYASGVTQSGTSYLGEPILNGSGNNAFLARFGDITTGISPVGDGSGVTLYPNPCAGVFTVDLPPDARTVVITDVEGREQVSTPVKGLTRSSFHLAAPGVYFVAITSDSGRNVRRVVAE